MNKFEKAQALLKELNGDGWLIVCDEGSDVNSRFLLGVGSHARHYIYVAANGEHKVLAVEDEERPQKEEPKVSKELEEKFARVEKIIENNEKRYKSSALDKMYKEDWGKKYAPDQDLSEEEIVEFNNAFELVQEKFPAVSEEANGSHRRIARERVVLSCGLWDLVPTPRYTTDRGRGSVLGSAVVEFELRIDHLCVDMALARS